ncbi:acyltransferase family protein [Bifidobacterium adolescentis]|uniref:acyltransferase family protein n=1 Tax=Bifidobacterium adolescentis TaxID=1680 RepID=UPI00398CD48E
MDENIQRANGSGAHIRHAAPAHSRNSNGGGCRNSSIELLRIIAMFMILMHHFIVHNGYDVLKLPLGPERIFFQLVMQGGGKVGVVIFFSISAWFFLDKEQTIKSNLKRVWIMERELLFWSLILVAFYLVFDRADLGMKNLVKSFAPLTMNVWWYATDYAASEKLLWVRLFNLQNLYQQPWAILLILGILLAIYAICTLLDFIRQALFAVTIDKRRGRWFELLWDRVSKLKRSRLNPPLDDSANTR